MKYFHKKDVFPFHFCVAKKERKPEKMARSGLAWHAKLRRILTKKFTRFVRIQQFCRAGGSFIFSWFFAYFLIKEKVWRKRNIKSRFCDVAISKTHVILKLGQFAAATCPVHVVSGNFLVSVMPIGTNNIFLQPNDLSRTDLSRTESREGREVSLWTPLK